MLATTMYPSRPRMFSIGTLIIALLLGTALNLGIGGGAARADTTTTITNFDASGNQVTRYDVNDNAIDAHDGGISQFGDTYYLYGTSYDCGFVWQQSGAPFCGFKSYTSTDLVHWADQGFLFDASTPTWQARCGGSTIGCFRPHVLYNSALQKYILWMNDYSVGVGFRVFESAAPIGPFTEVAVPTLAFSGTAGAVNNGDENLFLDSTGTAYLTYTNWQQSGNIIIEQLNAQFESGTGNYASLGTSSTEAPAMFKRNGIYYVTYSDPNCGYCNSTGTSYKTASTPLGTWTAGTKFTANSCGGQPTHVATVATTSGTTYLYQSDLWNGSHNEALANYFWAPLSFNSNGSIQNLPCTASFSLTLTGGVAGSQNIPTNRDQWDGIAGYRTWCDIGGAIQRVQTFTAGQSGTLSSVSFTTFQEYAPNAGLTIDLVSVNGSGTPTGTLSSTTIPVSAIGWSARKVTVKPNISVTAGTHYGIVAHAALSSGCYGLAYNDGNVYAAGQELYSSNSGGSYTLESNRALKFETTIGGLGNLATSATPAASSAFSACCGWGLAHVNDGLTTSTGSSMGWSSANTLGSNHAEWVQLDLGTSHLVSQVNLYPREDAGNVGYGYPIDLTVQLSPNGVNWMTVATQTGNPSPTSGAVKTYIFTTRDARFIRVMGTNLSNANPNDPTYRMQLAEMEVTL